MLIKLGENYAINIEKITRIRTKNLRDGRYSIIIELGSFCNIFAIYDSKEKADVAFMQLIIRINDAIKLGQVPNITHETFIKNEEQIL